MNYNRIKKQLKDATRITFEGCIARIPEKEISGLGLYTDESVMSLSVSCNTIQHLKEQQADEPNNDCYFKWTMGEWKYEMINQKQFSDINKELIDKHNKIANNQGAFITHRSKIFSIAVEVLEELRDEMLFDKMSDDFLLMFGVSEYDDKALEKEFVRRLNSDNQYQEFSVWINSEA